MRAVFVQPCRQVRRQAGRFMNLQPQLWQLQRWAVPDREVFCSALQASSASSGKVHEPPAAAAAASEASPESSGKVHDPPAAAAAASEAHEAAADQPASEAPKPSKRPKSSKRPKPPESAEGSASAPVLPGVPEGAAPSSEPSKPKAKPKMPQGQARGKAKAKASAEKAEKKTSLSAETSLEIEPKRPSLRRQDPVAGTRTLGQFREAMVPMPQDGHLRRSNSLDVLPGLDDELYEGEVMLQVYHLAKAVKAVGLPIYHTGVEVYGVEHFFCLDGVQACRPKGYGQGVHKISVALGKTRLSSSRVDQAIKKLKPKWPGQDYKLLSHNCQSFAVELVSLLLPNVDFPSEYCRFAGPRPKPKPKPFAVYGKY
ncbi:Desumoylating isopeptidase 1 homolog (DeSI-1) (Polyubiquitinated substrate transporter) (POST) [Durusdinium trenchii]|uniref:Desumoylating isopeptidase 1 homolog (DeSI-1) (Polyubiquitinated substrate transporter) (POST) n=2 Tax=Durusdinium trenchii TaxID=1381693 RepID=A0ABP0R646_9DINO